MGIIVIGLFSIQYAQYNGATLTSREKFLNKEQIGVNILSESLIDNYIISEIKNSHNQYGYALFKPKGHKRYTFVSSMLTDKDCIATHLIWIGEIKYELFMCDKPQLNYVEIAYTNSDTLQTTTQQLPLLNNTIAIVEAPNLKSYYREVCFFDVTGNKYK